MNRRNARLMAETTRYAWNALTLLVVCTGLGTVAGILIRLIRGG